MDIQELIEILLSGAIIILVMGTYTHFKEIRLHREHLERIKKIKER